MRWQRCPPTLSCAVMSVLLPRMCFLLLFINISIGKYYRMPEEACVFVKILQKESEYLLKTLSCRQVTPKNYEVTDIKLACERSGSYLYHGLVELYKVLEARERCVQVLPQPPREPALPAPRRLSLLKHKTVHFCCLKC